MRPWVLALGLAGCSPGSVELLVELDADPELIHRIEEVVVDAADGRGPIARETFATAESCLPFSFGVVAESPEVELSLAFRGPSFSVERELQVLASAEGTSIAEFHLDVPCALSADQCRSLTPEALEAWLEQRGLEHECRRALDEPACRTAGGCPVADTDPAACVIPCPAPTIAPPAPPVAPTPPEAPRFGPCRPGLASRSRGGIETCELEALECPPGRVAFPGEPCRALVDDCVPPGPDAIWVSRGATLGDGSRTRPYGSVSEALAAAPDHARIALLPGVYAEGLLSLERPVTIVGACSSAIALTVQALSVFAPATLGDLALEVGDKGLSVETSTLTLERVHLRGASSALGVARRGHLEARALWLEGTLGVFVSGGSARLDRVVKTGGRGPFAEVLDARLEVSRFVVRGGEGGLTGGPGAEVSLGEGAILDTPAPIALTGGRLAARDLLVDGGGPIKVEGATLTLDRAVILGLTGEAAIGALAGAAVTITDSTIQGAAGSGAEVKPSGALTLRRVSLHDVSDGGVRCRGRLSAEDLTIEASRPLPGGLYGAGLIINQGGTARIDRLAIRDVHRYGIFLGGLPPPSLAVTDATIERVARDADPRPLAGTSTGEGILVLSGTLLGERVRVAAATKSGLGVAGNASVELLDLEVGEVQTSNDGAVGLRIEGGEVSIARATLAPVAAVTVERGSLTLNDASVDATTLDDTPAFQLAGATSLSRIRTAMRPRAVSLGAARLTLVDAHLVGAECEPVACPRIGLLDLFTGANLEATRFHLDGRGGRGAIARRSSILRLEHGKIAGFGTGLLLEDPGPSSIYRLGVGFADNGQDVVR